ncbi:transcript variant X6 [Nothobranchius furzeri]|uniref:Transcript variant X6 n=1 Tax=Nothobranchius furzeri TaxID=105023 RepID=A0A9D3BJQ1_NOTFU|nr:transcript variant X6 [Nothobranchius furzeri]
MPLTEEPVRPLKVSHHVQQPPAASRKKGDLQQQLKHIHLSQAAGFSSDEDDPEQDGADPKEAERLDPSDLTDDALRVTLLKYGVKPGPVVASTRALYERKLRTLLQPSGPEELNEAEIGILYSDSEGSEQDDREAAEMSDQTKPPSSKLPREPVQDVLKDLFPNTRTIPTGLYAAPRRPIKGAAGRPVQLAYPDPPVSPTTQERLEVQHRLVPAYIQILVFFTVVCVLYFIYVNVGDRNPGLALLESLNQWSEGEEGV